MVANTGRVTRTKAPLRVSLPYLPHFTGDAANAGAKILNKDKQTEKQTSASLGLSATWQVHNQREGEMVKREKHFAAASNGSRPVHSGFDVFI